MIKPKNGSSFYLGDFSPYIHKLEELGLADSYKMIGGLAVECWRRKYQNVRGVLKQEIASKDIDFIAGEETVDKLALALNRDYREQAFDENIMREFIIPGKSSSELKAQFLTSVCGVYDPKKGENVGLSIRLPFDQKTQVSVLDPVSIFTAKLAVCCQPVTRVGWIEETHRNDEAHMGVLGALIPTFLKEQTAIYLADKTQPNPVIPCRHMLGEMSKNMGMFPKFVWKCKQGIIDAARKTINRLDPVRY